MNAFMTNEKNNALATLDAYKAANSDNSKLINIISEFAYMEQADNVEFSVEMCRPINQNDYESFMSSEGKAPWITVNVDDDNIFIKIKNKNIHTCFCLNEVGDITYFKTEDRPYGKFCEIHFSYKGFEYWFKIFDWKK